eukprot:CAMPEP_0176255504 /NCGR_PEP_ID=MMETSP0121_2-20121125/37074_1 /TAXON_ID=160619 /ORGANISM="Kryptoperidinium foliaceum, Strain CCMP 1326" /LENGTH=362 /DNA_ID=CAMNT_0017595331 /DNA_START=42 /DNA_END=1127 /DNA_ORIENTATION=-
MAAARRVLASLLALATAPGAVAWEDISSVLEGARGAILGSFKQLGTVEGSACQGSKEQNADREDENKSSDESREYEVYDNIESLEICKALCADDRGCTGIEYTWGSEGGRCEVWNQGEGIRTVVPASGVACLSYTPEVFEPVDGGIHRACRGVNLYDIDPSYFVASGNIPSLRACQSMCVQEPSCKGIEYHPDHDNGRCELWTRPQGVGSTMLAHGYTCMRRMDHPPAGHERRLTVLFEAFSHGDADVRRRRRLASRASPPARAGAGTLRALRASADVTCRASERARQRSSARAARGEMHGLPRRKNSAASQPQVYSHPAGLRRPAAETEAPGGNFRGVPWEVDRGTGRERREVGRGLSLRS